MKNDMEKPCLERSGLYPCSLPRRWAFFDFDDSLD